MTVFAKVRHWRLALAGLLLILMLSISLAGKTLAQEEIAPSILDRVLDSKKLRIGTTGDYPPYTELDVANGRFEGLDIDLAIDLAESLGAEPVFVQTSWPTLMEDLAADRFDIGVGGISRALPRQRAAFFSTPYRRFGKTPIARCGDRERFDSLAKIDQPEVRVIVNPGGTNEAFALQHIKRAELIVYPDNRTIFTEIADDRADVMITDSDEVLYQQRIEPSLCATMPGRTFTESEKAFLMPRDMIWKLYVDAWFDELRLQGTLDRMFATYFGD